MNQKQRITELRSLRGRLRNLSTRRNATNLSSRDKYGRYREEDERQIGKTAGIGAGAVAGTAAAVYGGRAAAKRIGSLNTERIGKVRDHLKKVPMPGRRILSGRALIEARKKLR